jgi:hypothetical protein
MLNYGFKNHDEYQNLFGYRVAGNGVKVRRNKILLAFLKNRNSHKNEILKNYLSSTNLNTLCEGLLTELSKSSKGNCHIFLFNRVYYNNLYCTDSQNGICLDGDVTQYRYINYSTNKIYKMKIAKLFRAIMGENQLWQELSEQVQTYLCEKVANDWQAERIVSGDKYELVVNHDFDKIYNSHYCDGRFDSCMTDNDQYDFYHNAIYAKAAALYDLNSDKIVARCIIYQDVMNDDETEHYRLAERQYSTDCDNVLKTILVQKLIDGGYIDGYKKIGVGCHANDAFVLNDGSDLNIRLHIKNTIEPGDILSYQDSFIYLSVYEHKAYNKHICNYDYELNATDRYLCGEYDEYHDRYCCDIHIVYVHGVRTTCDADDMDDFVHINNVYEYHHIEDCVRCDDCGEWHLAENSYHSDITDMNYCSISCMENAEDEYKEDNWFWSDFDEEYFEYEDDIIEIYHYIPGTGYVTATISKSSLDDMESLEYDGKIYLEYNKFTNKPFDK